MTPCWSCGGDVPPDGPMPQFCTVPCSDAYWAALHDPVTDVEACSSRVVVNGVIDHVPAEQSCSWSVGAR